MLAGCVKITPPSMWIWIKSVLSISTQTRSAPFVSKLLPYDDLDMDKILSIFTSTRSSPVVSKLLRGGYGLNFGDRSERAPRLASEGNLWRPSRIWRRFSERPLSLMQGVTLWLHRSQCVSNLQEYFLFIKCDWSSNDGGAERQLRFAMTMTPTNPVHTHVP